MTVVATGYGEHDPFQIARDKLFGNPDLVELEADYREWLRVHLPAYFSMPFAEHQHEMWTYIWAIERGVQMDIDTLVTCFARGGAKSTGAEAGLVALGARRKRKYALYVCETQEQADGHVSTIESMLSSPKLAENYPSLVIRAVGMYGSSKGWRRNRLRTAIGFTVDAMGLDSAARGAKVEEDRPDIIVLDDVDGREDGVPQVEKKIRDITQKLLPAGSSDLVVIVAQNAIHQRSIVSRLVGLAPEEDKADFLSNRKVIGPIPAIRDIATEYRVREDGTRRPTIVGGTATWEGQSIEIAQKQMDLWGLNAFMQEAQHDVSAPPGGRYDEVEFVHCGWGEWPRITDITIWLDPAVTDKDESDAHGIQCDALANNGKIYRLFSWEKRGSPSEAMEIAIAKAYELEATVIGAETDQGGDTWIPVFEQAHEEFLKKNPMIRELIRVGRRIPPGFASEKAGAGHGSKVHRGEQMLAAYQRAAFVHVLGTHHVLERALKRWPRTKPLDLADAAYWSWWWLTQGTGNVLELQDGRLTGRR